MEAPWYKYRIFCRKPAQRRSVAGCYLEVLPGISLPLGVSTGSYFSVSFVLWPKPRTAYIGQKAAIPDIRGMRPSQPSLHRYSRSNGRTSVCGPNQASAISTRPKMILNTWANIPKLHIDKTRCDWKKSPHVNFSIFIRCRPWQSAIIFRFNIGLNRSWNRTVCKPDKIWKHLLPDDLITNKYQAD